VPEAAIHEDRHLELGKNKIRLPKQRPPPAPAGNAVKAKQLDQRQLGFLVAMPANAERSKAKAIEGDEAMEGTYPYMDGCVPFDLRLEKLFAVGFSRRSPRSKEPPKFIDHRAIRKHGHFHDIFLNRDGVLEIPLVVHESLKPIHQVVGDLKLCLTLGCEYRR
jgi:hypothetical protein